MFLAKSTMVCITVLIPSTSPFSKPLKILPTIVSDFLSSSNQFLIASAALLKPFTILSHMYFGILSDFVKPSNHFPIASAASFITGDMVLNIFSISIKESNQSLKPTIASPIPAVTSKISRWNMLRICFTTFKAIFNGPPITVAIISRMAKIPLKVLCNFLAVSVNSPVSLSVNLNFSENLFSPSMRLNN